MFAAFTDPKHLARWWGSNGFTTTTLSFDMRPGGVWRFVMHGPDGRDYQNPHHLRRDRAAGAHRLSAWRRRRRRAGAFPADHTFEDLGERTRIVWRGDFPSAAERDRVIKEYGADTGLVQTLARLADYVRSLS